jgi:hypothetical protein
MASEAGFAIGEGIAGHKTVHPTKFAAAAAARRVTGDTIFDRAVSAG